MKIVSVSTATDLGAKHFQGFVSGEKAKQRKDTSREHALALPCAKSNLARPLHTACSCLQGKIHFQSQLFLIVYFLQPA